MEISQEFNNWSQDYKTHFAFDKYLDLREAGDIWNAFTNAFTLKSLIWDTSIVPLD